MRKIVRRLVTLVNNEEHERILAYAEKKGLSLYALLKEALFEYMKRHPLK